MEEQFGLLMKKINNIESLEKSLKEENALRVEQDIKLGDLSREKSKVEQQISDLKEEYKENYINNILMIIPIFLIIIALVILYILKEFSLPILKPLLGMSLIIILGKGGVFLLRKKVKKYYAKKRESKYKEITILQEELLLIQKRWSEILKEIEEIEKKRDMITKLLVKERKTKESLETILIYNYGAYLDNLIKAELMTNNSDLKTIFRDTQDQISLTLEL